MQIAKRAWREGYKGLAAVIVTMWDGMMSPVDARTLLPSHRVRAGKLQAFAITRGKTDASAFAPITNRAAKVIDAYLSGRKVIDLDKPIFRTRRGAACTKNSLAEDIRDIRAMVFPGDTRKLSDIRRSGALEAAAGRVDPKALSDVMGNDIDSSRFLQKTYQPAQITTAATVSDARKRGRKARAANESGS